MTPSPTPERRTIGVLGAYIEGWRRVLKAPAVWAAILIVVLPAVVAIVHPGALIGSSRLTASLVRDTPEIERSQAFSLLGPGPLVVVMQVYSDGVVAVNPLASRLEGIADVNAVAVCLTLVIYLFLWGGILDRLARARVVGSGPFFAACGVYFWRLLRLGVPIALAYWLIWHEYASVHPSVSLPALLLVGIILSYAAIRMVVEDRRSALGAIVAALRFIRRRPIAVFALYVLNVATVIAISMVWTFLMFSNAVTESTVWSSPATIAGLLAHFLARLALAASAIALFQGSLAHAAYTAAPLPVWPDSPAAEAIENLALWGQRAKDRGQSAE